MTQSLATWLTDIKSLPSTEVWYLAAWAITAIFRATTCFMDNNVET
jgi:hypothetical protein